MRTIRKEITKDKYEVYSKMDSRFVKAEYEKNEVPVHISCGYGFYGVYFREEDGKYFAYMSVGDTCD